MRRTKGSTQSDGSEASIMCACDICCGTEGTESDSSWLTQQTQLTPASETGSISNSVGASATGHGGLASLLGDTSSTSVVSPLPPVPPVDTIGSSPAADTSNGQPHPLNPFLILPPPPSLQMATSPLAQNYVDALLTPYRWSSNTITYSFYDDESFGVFLLR